MGRKDAFGAGIFNIFSSFFHPRDGGGCFKSRISFLPLLFAFLLDGCPSPESVYGSVHIRVDTGPLRACDAADTSMPLDGEHPLVFDSIVRENTGVPGDYDPAGAAAGEARVIQVNAGGFKTEALTVTLAGTDGDCFELAEASNPAQISGVWAPTLTLPPLNAGTRAFFAIRSKEGLTQNALGAFSQDYTATVHIGPVLQFPVELTVLSVDGSAEFDITFAGSPDDQDVSIVQRPGNQSGWIELNLVYNEAGASIIAVTWIISSGSGANHVNSNNVNWRWNGTKFSFYPGAWTNGPQFAVSVYFTVQHPVPDVGLNLNGAHEGLTYHSGYVYINIR